MLKERIGDWVGDLILEHAEKLVAESSEGAVLVP